ncbi:hypothetical protein CICLE_v10006565mg, partial [Citrus x clementina]
MVLISYKDWSKVPSESKEKIWECVKNRLTTKYIKRSKHKPEALKCLPKMYDFIEQEDWEVFVRYRTSKRRAKNIYNHCLSRKGYVGLEDELQQAAGNKKDISRSTLWKTAHKNKKGRHMSEVIREKANEILLISCYYSNEYKAPARIDALCKYARRVLTKVLFIEIYPGIFDNEQVELYLSVDDIVQFCGMEKIGVATITCYMKHLYEVLKDHPLEHIYKFDNPSIFCDETGNNYETRAHAM